MEIIRKEIAYKDVKYFKNIEKSVFFDIETTGLSGKSAMCYLIGLMYKNGEKYVIEQYFAENKNEEKEIIVKFLEKLSEFEDLISFNGDGFDIPFINERIRKNSINGSIEISSHDVYKAVREYKSFLPVPNLKLKTLEKYQGVYREDKYSGGELINMYYDYLRTGNVRVKEDILLHNYEDIINMTILDDIMHNVLTKVSIPFQDDNRIILKKTSVLKNSLSLYFESFKELGDLYYESFEDSVAIDNKNIYIKLKMSENKIQGFKILGTTKNTPYYNRLIVKNHKLIPEDYLVFVVNKETNDELIKNTGVLFLEYALKMVNSRQEN